jgi:hypothetical protein
MVGLTRIAWPARSPHGMETPRDTATCRSVAQARLGCVRERGRRRDCDRAGAMHDSLKPTKHDSLKPTKHDSLKPTMHDSLKPTMYYSLKPTMHDSLKPTMHDSLNPPSQPMLLVCYQSSSAWTGICHEWATINCHKGLSPNTSHRMCVENCDINDHGE